MKKIFGLLFFLIALATTTFAQTQCKMECYIDVKANAAGVYSGDIVNLMADFEVYDWNGYDYQPTTLTITPSYNSLTTYVDGTSISRSVGCGVYVDYNNGFNIGSFEVGLRPRVTTPQWVTFTITKSTPTHHTVRTSTVSVMVSP